MNLTLLEWIVSVTAMVAVLLFDVVIIARRPHEPTMAECAARLSAYIGLAVLFGGWVWLRHGARFGMQFFAGWLTEYSLSVDNLFVFIIIIASFNVPRVYRQEALFVGIVLALLFRSVFIIVGGVAVQRLSWIFYLLGFFLAYIAVKVARGAEETGDGDNAVVRFARTHLTISDRWDGLRLMVNEGTPAHPKFVMTPMFLVVLALGTTDLLFALDSIPAVYGLTREPYLVMAANVFALMGLRQLYFILGDLMDRLVYLPQGLAVILGFIGLKMVLRALRINEVPFINGGRSVAVPEISTAASLVFIVATLTLTVAASLYRTRVAERD